jgi:hypothetical protein
MWQRIFISLFLFFSVSLNVTARDLLIDCQQLAPNYYQFTWDSPKGSTDTFYHVFIADHWDSLMPIEMPQKFIVDGNCSELLLTSTQETFVDLKITKPYVRIIADSHGVLSDVAPLMYFPALDCVDLIPNEIIEKKGSQRSKRAKMLEKVSPYLISEQHPAKAKLDRIFAQKGVLATEQSMKDAGFDLLCYREGRGLVVARHPLLKGYLLKTYLDDAKHAEWNRWVRRSKGSRLVQKCINGNGYYQRAIKVPQKWIYQLPTKSIGSSTSVAGPREFVLLVEDMRLLDLEDTKLLYLKWISCNALDALFNVIDKSGYSDSHIGNVPISRDKRIALIDTEFTNNWPVHPEWLTKFFSPHKQIYWQQLISEMERRN